MDSKYNEGYEVGLDRGDKHARYVDAYGAIHETTAGAAASEDRRCLDEDFGLGFVDGWAEGVQQVKDECEEETGA